MKAIFLVLISSFTIIFNCSSQVNSKRREVHNLYQEIISLYPEALVTDFPKTVIDKVVGYHEFNYPRGRYVNYIHMILLLKDNEVEALKEELTLKSKAIYHFSDSCLMPIPYDYYNFEIISSDSTQWCKSTSLLPISNFKLWRANFRPIFYKDATIYLLNAEKGRFLDDDLLSKYGVGLSDDWLHGYSKGIAIFQNFALYWLDV